ncbi:MAG: putative glycoside hydrolase [Eubacteriales bacterium]
MMPKRVRGYLIVVAVFGIMITGVFAGRSQPNSSSTIVPISNQSAGKQDSKGNYGFSNPNAYPYEVVDGSIKDINRLIESTGCRIRPWLQAFSMGPPRYGPNEVVVQYSSWFPDCREKCVKNPPPYGKGVLCTQDCSESRLFSQWRDRTEKP